MSTQSKDLNLRLAELEETVRSLQIEVADREESEQLLKEREKSYWTSWKMPPKA